MYLEVPLSVPQFMAEMVWEPMANSKYLPAVLHLSLTG
jgi:hypothetical protein